MPVGRFRTYSPRRGRTPLEKEQCKLASMRVGFAKLKTTIYKNKVFYHQPNDLLSVRDMLRQIEAQKEVVRKLKAQESDK